MKTMQEMQAEINALQAENQALKSRVLELDNKLNDAFALNAREASMEAEKIKFELEKAFGFILEDFEEYGDNNENSIENYESLKAIIKKCFRAVARIGIKIKGYEPRRR